MYELQAGSCEWLFKSPLAGGGGILCRPAQAACTACCFWVWLVVTESTRSSKYAVKHTRQATICFASQNRLSLAYLINYPL